MDLLVKYISDTVTVHDQFVGTASGIEQVYFGNNGVTWDRSTILGKATIFGTSGADTYTGHADDDPIDGQGGDDVINGAGGNDTLTGGSGDDTFVFETGTGRDKIADFSGGASSGDIIRILGFAVDTYAEVLAAAAQVGNDLVITLDDDASITLLNRTVANLHQHDFIFAT